MDVNYSSSIAAVHPEGRQTKQGHDQHPEQKDKSTDPDADSGSWRDKEAVDLDRHLLEAQKPEVKEMIDSLYREIEPLRLKLGIAEKQLEEVRKSAARHDFLDIPSHAEMRRDLDHILSHKGNLSSPPVLALLHIANSDDVRQRFGRSGQEAFLSDVCQRISQQVLSADTFGSLGGNDFALIMLGRELDMAKQSLVDLMDRVSREPVNLSGQAICPDIRYGVIDLRFTDSVEAAVSSVDRNLSEGTSGP